MRRWSAGYRVVRLEASVIASDIEAALALIRAALLVYWLSDPPPSAAARCEAPRPALRVPPRAAPKARARPAVLRHHRQGATVAAAVCFLQLLGDGGDAHLSQQRQVVFDVPIVGDAAI